MIIDCKAGGNITRFPIHLRVSSTPRPDMPSPASDLPRPSTRTTVLQALSEEDMTRISNSELVKRGYPVRPNAKKDSEAFTRWKKIVSKPITVIEPQVVASDIRRQTSQTVRTDSFPSTSTSNIWSGVVLNANQINYVTGTWAIPTVTSATGKLEVVSFWVGIDGWYSNTPDLPQTGIEAIAAASSYGLLTVF